MFMWRWALSATYAYGAGQALGAECLTLVRRWPVLGAERLTLARRWALSASDSRGTESGFLDMCGPAHVLAALGLSTIHI